MSEKQCWPWLSNVLRGSAFLFPWNDAVSFAGSPWFCFGCRQLNQTTDAARTEIKFGLRTQRQRQGDLNELTPVTAPRCVGFRRHAGFLPFHNQRLVIAHAPLHNGL